MVKEAPCAVCGKLSTNCCSACFTEFYCSPEHQRSHWETVHAYVCDARKNSMQDHPNDLNVVPGDICEARTKALKALGSRDFQSCKEIAVDSYRKIWYANGPRSPLLIAESVLLARAAIGLGEKALALQHIVFIADMATAEPYTNSNMNVALWSLVAELHYMLDDVAEAITHYKKWITMVDKHITDYFIRADAYSIMASFFLSLKDYPQALVYSKLCYEYRERVYLTEQAVLETAKRNAYCNHAIILSLSKKGMEAINFWNKAMVLAKGPLDEARVLEKAAKCFTAAGDYNNAVSFYARCFEAYLAYEKQTHKRLPTSDLTAYLTAYSQYVVILFEEMEDLKKAEMACIRCVELLEKHYGSESLDTASGYYMLGMVLLKSGWQANGKKALDKAEHILRSSNDPMHRDMVKNCQLCK